MTAALTPDPSTVLAALDPVGLDDLVATAALQARVDRKYVVPVDRLADLLDGLEPGTRVLEIDGRRDFGYESVYFDTSDLHSYLLAAHRRRRRFKIRTRTYLDTGSCWLEVKTRGRRGMTVKHRTPHAMAHRDSLHTSRDFAQQTLEREALDWAAGLDFRPTLTTRYRRATLLLPSSASRATVDTGLGWVDDDGSVLRAPGVAIVETKTGSTPSSLDRRLWRCGHRPARISKYATGLAALNPDLPSGPWNRTLTRHFDPDDTLDLTGRTDDRDLRKDL